MIQLISTLYFISLEHMCKILLRLQVQNKITWFTAKTKLLISLRIVYYR